MTALLAAAVLAAGVAPANLAGVVNADKAKALPKAARDQLVQQGFTVIEGEERHFFSLYDRNAYAKVPSFISSDVVLHVFHVRFDEDLTRLELARAVPALRDLATGQLARALEQSKRDVALFHATALKLLEPERALDARIDADATAAAKALEDTKPYSHPSCPTPLDATRFKPRGHYDNYSLRGYFRAFTFYSSCAFPLTGPGAEKARAIAALIDEPARASLATLTRLVELVGGKTDSVPLDLVAKGTPPAGAARPTFRLLGAAETSEAALFERTVPARLAAKQEPFPSVLDVFAALGSEEARTLLAPSPALDAELRAPLKLDDSLSGRWLRVLQKLVTRPRVTKPAFAATDAWARRTLVSAAGSWAELKHDTLLYVRQPMVMMEGGHDAELPATKVGGYVDPRPDVYRELLAMREALDVPAKDDALAGFLQFIIEVSELELADKPFPKALDERLRTVGGELEHLSRTRGDKSPPQALIADVFTLAQPDGPSRVFHVATGHVDELWVVAPRAGKLVLMRGGAFSFYEVIGAPNERLSDREWFQRLESPPPRPPWATPLKPAPHRKD